MKRTKSRLGSSFEDFLAEEGLAGDANAHAIKRVLASQIEQVIKQKGIGKAEMARRMKTSRVHLDRFLDPATTASNSTPFSARRRPSAANCGWN